MTALERRYEALVDEYGELELSPTKFAEIERLFDSDPNQPPALVQAPLAYDLGGAPGLELRVRPLLVLKLARERPKTGKIFYRFEYRLTSELVPDLD